MRLLTFSSVLSTFVKNLVVMHILKQKWGCKWGRKHLSTDPTAYIQQVFKKCCGENLLLQGRKLTLIIAWRQTPWTMFPMLEIVAGDILGPPYMKMAETNRSSQQQFVFKELRSNREMVVGQQCLNCFISSRRVSYANERTLIRGSPHVVVSHVQVIPMVEDHIPMVGKALEKRLRLWWWTVQPRQKTLSLRWWSTFQKAPSPRHVSQMSVTGTLTACRVS